MTDVNPLDTIVTLITTNYDNSNTDSVTPLVAKIYEKPLAKEPRPGEDFIFVYGMTTQRASRGMNGNNKAEIIEPLRIDIRVRTSNTAQNSKTDDTHARKVRGEVDRILYNNILTPGSGFDNIDPNMEVQDLSNGSRGIFRYVYTVRLNDWCRDMTL